MFQDKKIGERFKYKGVTLEVVDIYNSDCAGCFDCFFNDIGCENISCSPYTGRKTDSVCFKVVKGNIYDNSELFK